jgi:hypothetical protein
MAQAADRKSPPGEKVFSRFKEKNKITGFSVTQALLSRHPRAEEAALRLLEDLAKNGAAGIKALILGQGRKDNWTRKEKKYWQGLKSVIIGGGVSEGLTGKRLVSLIKRSLAKEGLLDIRVEQAKFPGKEAGFLGAIINVIELVLREARQKRLRKIAAVGLDLGRQDIGAGTCIIDVVSKKIMLNNRKQPWFFQDSIKTPFAEYRQAYLDCRRDYNQKEYRQGIRIRNRILDEMVDLIVQSRARAEDLGFFSSSHIGVATPGAPSQDGAVLNSTDYLPFFRKQDRFNLKEALQELLGQRGLFNYQLHLLNDGIAAGAANAYFSFSKIRRGKFAFFGVGSGLGGCVGWKLR